MAYLEKVEIEASTASVEIRNFLERREAFLKKIRMIEIFSLM